MKSQEKEINLYKYEEELYDNGFEAICGVDEAGRGPLAGPVVVAACILPPFLRIDGINDSKQLSEKKREELYKIIVKNAVAYNVVFINEKTIDEINIYEATKKGMLEAIEGLKVKPDYILIDAMPLGELKQNNKSIIHGDALSASIAAASILAKVSRDHYMDKMDIKYPNYGFKHNKGYGTKLHMEALEKFGPCKIHRKSFEPVRRASLKTRQISLDLFNDENEEN
jgi:ribonuclease HII